MSKAFESALEAVRRMSPGAEIDAALWPQLLHELQQNAEQTGAARTQNISCAKANGSVG